MRPDLTGFMNAVKSHIQSVEVKVDLSQSKVGLMAIFSRVIRDQILENDTAPVGLRVCDQVGVKVTLANQDQEEDVVF